MKFKQHIDRGVWEAPFFGPNRELMYLLVDRHHRLVCAPVPVSPVTDDRALRVHLYKILDAIDPGPRDAGRSSPVSREQSVMLRRFGGAL